MAKKSSNSLRKKPVPAQKRRIPTSIKRRLTTIQAVGKMTGGVAIQSRSVRVVGSVVGRDQYNITQVIQMAAFTPPSDLKKLRKDYLDHLRRIHRVLDFKGIPQLEALSRELLLEDVYVPLIAQPEIPAGEAWEQRFTK